MTSMEAEAAGTQYTTIPDTVRYMTTAEANRVREFAAQREGAVAIANAAAAAARQVVSNVETEIESLKAHYGIARSAKVNFDLDAKTLTIEPEEMREV